MPDLRPLGYVLGLVVVVLGLTMLVPMVTDYALGNGNAHAFAESCFICLTIGGFTAIACQNRAGRSLTIRQAFLLTIGIWAFVPLFGTLPFMLGAPEVRLIDAYFEAVSGITTTGSSVFVGVDDLPAGTNLWRGMLNWLGGLGIAFIAMIFLPLMRVGGMQFFRTEGFDTFGKVLPRATDIAWQLLWVYAGLTVACMLTYSALGMLPLHAVVHGLATIATGGFSPLGSSFSTYQGAAEYAGAAFMILGSMPYVRFVQLVNGHSRPLYEDPQVRAYLRWIVYAVGSVTLWRVATSDQGFESSLREALFNLVSIFSSTGFGSGSFVSWGSFPMVVALCIGTIGACSGSSAAGLTVFRVQLVLATVLVHIRKIHAPHNVTPVKYAGRRVDNDTLDGLILYVGAYILTFGVFSVAITMSGVDVESAIFASWTSLGNIGYGYGPLVQATGTFVEFPDAAKIVMILAMLMGRLALLAVFVVVLPRFWQK